MRARIYLINCLLDVDVQAVTTLPQPSDPNLTHDLQSIYVVDFTKDDRGGCKSYQPKLETAYAQTISALYHAQAAAATLKQPRPDKKEDIKAYNDWMRVWQAVYDMFGVEVSKKKGAVDGEGAEIIRRYNGLQRTVSSADNA